MSKISKIQSIKQEKRYRNETMNILNHMNNKLRTPTLADKSLHNFKSIKPEVQSSRLTRYEPTKVTTKHGANYYIGYSRDREKKVDSQIGQKMSSKSLQSIHGSLKTYRKEQDKTKKNSFARMVNQNGYVNVEKSGAQHNNQRFKTLQVIFNNAIDQETDNVNDHFDKDISKWQVPTNYISVKKSNSSSYRMQNPENSLTQKLIENLNRKFDQFYEVIKQRKVEMIYDQIDYALYFIISALQSNFLDILSSLFDENEKQIANTELTIQRIMAEQEEQLKISRQKCQKIKQNYLIQIQELITKSLYTIDKVNQIQKEGLFNFEHLCRQLDLKSGRSDHLPNNWSQFDEDSLAFTKTFENIMKDNSITNSYQYTDLCNQNILKKGIKQVPNENKSSGHGYIKKIR